jgi:hypothetical protein
MAGGPEDFHRKKFYCLTGIRGTLETGMLSGGKCSADENRVALIHL